MESKVVSLEVIPDHPKYVRLPSLSRSLIHSILPKACQEMHLHPSIFAINTKPSQMLGPPILATSKEKKRQQHSPVISRPDNIRPIKTSYTYSKLYQSKPDPQIIHKHYYTPKHAKTAKKITQKLFYCEVNPVRYRKQGKKRFWPILNTAQIIFSNHNETQENLRHIPEVHSSMEGSEFTVESMTNFTKLVDAETA